jgi:hypothetical protein
MKIQSSRLSRCLLVLSGFVGTLACGAASEDGEDGIGDALPEDRLAQMHEHGFLTELDSSATRDKAADFAFVTSSSIGRRTGYFINDSVCMISGGWGDFSSDQFSGSVVVTHLNTGEWSVFQGSRGTGQVVCTKFSNFILPASSVAWISDEGWLTRTTDGASTRSFWWGDAITYLIGAKGEFEGGSESAHISQSKTASAASVLTLTTQEETFWQDTWIQAGARSFFIGVPNAGRLVKLYGFRDGGWVRGDMTSSGTFHFTVGEAGGFSSYWLAPYDNAVCYLVRFSGELDTGADKVQISKNGSQFFLAQTGNAIGTARCMAYDQRG